MRTSAIRRDFVILKFIILNYVLSQLYKSFSDPHRLNYLEIRAESDKHAQKLLYVVKFADVLVARLLGDNKILQGEHRELVGNLDGGGVGYLHLHEGAFRLEGGSRHAVGKLVERVVVIAGEYQG